MIPKDVLKDLKFAVGAVEHDCDGGTEDPCPRCAGDRVVQYFDNKDLQKYGIVCDWCGRRVVHRDRSHEEAALDHHQDCGWAKFMLGKIERCPANPHKSKV